MIIRGYNEIDLQDILDLLEELRGSSESSRFDIYLKDSNTYKNTYLKEKNYNVLVAKDEGKIKGFMISEHYENDTIGLTMLYTGLNFRRQGIAKRLKDEMEKLCRAKGYKKIVSRVRTNNVESVALNLKSGWEAHIDKVYPDYYFEFRKYL